MIRPTRSALNLLSLALWLVVSLPGLAMAEENADNKTQTPASASHGDKPKAQTGTDKAPPPESEGSDAKADRFDPSEEISKDLSVSFPIDI